MRCCAGLAGQCRRSSYRERDAERSLASRAYQLAIAEEDPDVAANYQVEARAQIEPARRFDAAIEEANRVMNTSVVVPECAGEVDYLIYGPCSVLMIASRARQGR